ncbi:MAG TPA: D-alanine--D-alanine ligase, partial [Clostridiales bacterium]|nr:D-alanine--D-alanine ligase [Clostridiales bacterium]
MENESVPPLLAVGITYNLKKGVISDAEDIEAEYDSVDTIDAIADVFRSVGIRVEYIEADADIVEKIKKAKVDIVFNIAEGANGRGREAQIPAILSFLGIPYSGSDETTLAIALDKAITKRYLSTYHILTPDYQLVTTPNFQLDPSLQFPLIVKPN